LSFTWERIGLKEPAIREFTELFWTRQIHEPNSIADAIVCNELEIEAGH
jgi:hypothetical protein